MEMKWLTKAAPMWVVVLLVVALIGMVSAWAVGIVTAPRNIATLDGETINVTGDVVKTKVEYFIGAAVAPGDEVLSLTTGPGADDQTGTTAVVANNIVARVTLDEAATDTFPGGPGGTISLTVSIYTDGVLRGTFDWTGGGEAGGYEIKETVILTVDTGAADTYPSTLSIVVE